MIDKADTLKECLLRDNLDSLKWFAKGLGIKKISKLKKDDLAQVIADTIKAEPQRLVEILFYYELDLYKRIISSEEAITLFDFPEGFDFNRFGVIDLVIIGRNEKMRPKYIMPSDFPGNFAELCEKEIEAREQDYRNIIESFVFGYANLYGFTALDLSRVIYKHICEADKINFSEEFLVKAKKPFLVETGHINSNSIDDVKIPVFSPLFPIDEELGNAMFENHDKYGLKEFEIEDICDYGQLPLVKFPFKSADKLRDVIKKYGYNLINPEVYSINLWIHKQLDADYSLNSFLEDMVYVESEEQLWECADAYTAFMNDVPMYRFGGYSSKEIAEKDGGKKIPFKNGLPQVKIGPGLRALGIESIEQLQAMAMLGVKPNGVDLADILEGMISTARMHNESADSQNVSPGYVDDPFTMPKVGRNEPCPCGSGKKYKHCHGKK